MEAFQVHGGYVSFRDSGDKTFPRRAVLIRSDQETLWMDGQTDDDAWHKLDLKVSEQEIEHSEPNHL